MQKEGAQCCRGKQQLQRGGWVTPGTGLIEPVPVPHTDGRADGKAEEGSHRIDVVCRRHCTVRWQGSGHGGVLGDVEESPGREGNPSQSTGDPVHGLFLRTERPRKETTSEDPWEEVERDKHFKHRRTSIEVEGRMGTEIANRVEAAWKNWKRCSGMLCDKRMPVKLKGNVYRTAVRPAMLYGAEIWATTKWHAGSKD